MNAPFTITDAGWLTFAPKPNPAHAFIEALPARVRRNFYRLIGYIEGDTLETILKRTEARYQRELSKRSGWVNPSKPHWSYDPNTQLALRELVDALRKEMEG